MDFVFCNPQAFTCITGFTRITGDIPEKHTPLKVEFDLRPLDIKANVLSASPVTDLEAYSMDSRCLWSDVWLEYSEAFYENLGRDNSKAYKGISDVFSAYLATNGAVAAGATTIPKALLPTSTKMCLTGQAQLPPWGCFY